MYLYNLTLQRATNISHCVAGNFSGQKKLEIIVSRGKILEILAPDENTGKVQSLLSTEIFGVIRSITPFRLTGGNKDYVLIGSDSGRIVILEYNPNKNSFEKVHQETFGKSGCRRIVPGQYIATDPRGRAVMVAALEKQKLVYILNRDSAARLTISSPLEAHKAHTIVFALCGVDVGFENPIFACLEVDYEENAGEVPAEGVARFTKNLTFYELDLGLNHVVRKWSEPTDLSANLLIPVPGGTDGPGGVLVCAEDFIIYKNQGVPEKRCRIPKREGYGDRSILIVSFATHKQKDLFFFLIQSEVGDLYKVSLPYSDDEVTDVVVKYFDTAPVSNSLCVLKNGFLFVASEFGNHMFYQFKGLGDETTDLEVNTETLEEVTFRPRGLLNLKEVDKLDSLSPILDFKVLDLFREETPQLYALCGRGPRSSLRILRHGLEVTEIANSRLPSNPTAVWTVRQSLRAENDKFIVVSFSNSTLVLEVGESVVEVQDSGFLATTSTLVAANIGEDGLVQVHPNGIRHIRGGRVHEWKTPGKKTITHATANELQVAIALSGGELFYFELSPTGQLTEIMKRDLGRDVACLGMAPISKGRQRGQFLAVGDYENTVRILTLSPDDPLMQVAMQALPTTPESLVVVEMDPSVSASAPSTGLGTLFLNIGLKNGVLLRTVLDHVTGELTDTRSRLLGVRPVKLFRMKVRGANAVLSLSSRPWVTYTHAGRFHMTPLSYLPLEYGAQFTSELCPEGMVAIAGDTLRIITLERLGETFNQTETRLRYTPRKFVVHPMTNSLVIIETDHNTYPEAEREEHKYELQKTEDAMDTGDSESGPAPVDLALIGAPPAGDGKWASCVRLFNVHENNTLDLIELEDNESAVSLCTCVFHERMDEVYVVVGTAKDLKLKPRRSAGGFVHIYKIEERKLVLVHKTAVDDVPTALCPFQGRLLVGLGKMLRIYDMGKKKLLRKCENKNFPNIISAIHTQGDRIVCADVQESFHFVKYKRSENSLYIFADDTAPRYVTSSAILDYDTMAGADKFGNLFVVRLPEKVNEDIEDDPTGNRVKWEQGYLNGAPYKVEHQIHFHAGETINSIAKAALVPGAMEVLLYTTVTGGIGALIPFVSREDVDFFSHLEMHLRQENPPLCGRDHLSYRSYYFPVKNVIDGDLCEQFTAMDPAKQRQIASELDRTPTEVAKKLEDIRNNRLL